MQIPISEVKAAPRGRKFVDHKFLDRLAESFKENGQQVPILVDTEMNLIDGLLRLTAASKLGWEKVEVEVADTYEVMLDNLGKAHSRKAANLRRDITLRRVWEIYKASLPLMQERVSRIRSMTNAEKRKVANNNIGRNPMPAALGISANTFQAVRSIYLGAEQLDGPLGDVCREERDKLDQGLTYPSSALKRFNTAQRKVDGAIDVATQRKVLEKVMIHLRSIDSALATLGPLNSEVTQEEVDEWLRTLYTSNTTLFRLRAVLRKERFKQ